MHVSIVTLLGIAATAIAAPQGVSISNIADESLARITEALNNNPGILGDLDVSFHTDLHMYISSKLTM